jgi:hypothetical protein
MPECILIPGGSLLPFDSAFACMPAIVTPNRTG